jgi:hypothetical protein
MERVIYFIGREVLWWLKPLRINARILTQFNVITKCCGLKPLFSRRVPVNWVVITISL